MDDQTFADLSRRVGAAATRRRALWALIGGAGAALLGRATAPSQVAEAAFGLCKAPGRKCNRNVQCCAGKCKKGACGCRKNGKPAAIGAICCSGKVRGGKCRKK